MPYRAPVTSALVLIAAAALSTCPVSAAHPFDPRPVPALGPFFDGYYVRVTTREFDTPDLLSVAALAGIVYGDGEAISAYFAVLAHRRGGRGLLFFDDHPPPSSARFEACAPTSPPLPGPCFTLSFEGGSFAMQNGSLSLHFALGDSQLLIQTLGEAVPWGRDGRDPEGVLGRGLAPLPLHWGVFSLASPAEGDLAPGGGAPALGFRGWAHVEKNWGRAFPPAWIWLQAAARNGSAQLSVTGGPPVPGSPSFYFGSLRVRDGPRQSWTSRPGQDLVRAKPDPCGGRLALAFERLDLLERVEVEAACGPGSAAAPCLAVPTARGFLPGAREAFGCRAAARVYRRGPGLAGLWPGGGWRLHAEFSFEEAALEFGGESMCTPCGS